MGEITEVFEDIREKIGDKWFFIFIGVAVLFGLYNLIKGSNESGEQLTTVTSISSYPDAVTNANVIIDTIQNSIEYSEDRITDAIGTTKEELSNQMGANFEQTNSYIKDGFESQEKLLQTNFDSIESGLGSLQNSMTSIKNDISNLGNKIDVNTNISAMTYYETMLHQGRDGYISYNPQQATSALQNAGFDTSKEQTTKSTGALTNEKASVVGTGWTTFTGSNYTL